MKIEESKATRLNAELLQSDEESSETTAKFKRGSKHDLIAKINRVVDEYDLELEHSQTKLKRMNKEALTKVLAGVMEQSVKQDMAKAAGCDPRAGGRVITLNALRMLHNISATGFESIANRVAGPYMGCEIDGFAEALRHPDIQPSIDECLTEIAAENPEVLEYFESPYARLALVWSGVLLTCIKKKVHSLNKDATRVGPQTSRGQDSYGPRVRWSSSVRKEHGVQPPVIPNVEKV